MPIHDQSYRRYKGEHDPQGRAWTVIATAGIRNMLAKRMFLGLLIVAWLPFIVRSVQMYLAANMPQLSIIAPSPKMFRDFLDFQGLFTFFITIFTGAGLISNDMRANALQIYLSKPLDRIEYVAGKFAVLACFLLLVTWLPATMLLVIQLVFAGSLEFITANYYVLPAIIVYSGIETVVLSLVMLALSSGRQPNPGMTSGLLKLTFVLSYKKPPMTAVLSFILYRPALLSWYHWGLVFQSLNWPVKAARSLCSSPSDLNGINQDPETSTVTASLA